MRLRYHIINEVWILWLSLCRVFVIQITLCTSAYVHAHEVRVQFSHHVRKCRCIWWRSVIMPPLTIGLHAMQPEKSRKSISVRVGAASIVQVVAVCVLFAHTGSFTLYRTMCAVMLVCRPEMSRYSTRCSKHMSDSWPWKQFSRYIWVKNDN